MSLSTDGRIASVRAQDGSGGDLGSDLRPRLWVVRVK
jgi:hypothetical protein